MVSADSSGQVSVWEASNLAIRWSRQARPKGITKLAAARILGEGAIVSGRADGTLAILRASDGVPLAMTAPAASITALCNISHESFLVCREDAAVEHWSPPYDAADLRVVLEGATESLAASPDTIAVAFGGTIVLLGHDLRERGRIAVSASPVRLLRVDHRSLLVGSSDGVSEWTLSGERVRDWAVGGISRWSPVDADHWVVSVKVGDLYALGIVGSEGHLLARRLVTRWPIASVASAGDGRVLAGTYGGEIISWDPCRDAWWQLAATRASDLVEALSRRFLPFGG